MTTLTQDIKALAEALEAWRDAVQNRGFVSVAHQWINKGEQALARVPAMLEMAAYHIVDANKMVLLDPDMPDQELRLHMGELTADEMLVARAAIRWANSKAEEPQ